MVFLILLAVVQVLVSLCILGAITELSQQAPHTSSTERAIRDMERATVRAMFRAARVGDVIDVDGSEIERYRS